MRLFVFHNTEDRKTVSERGHREWTDLTRTIHEHLLQRPILSPGGAFLVRSSRRTASTHASPSRARSPRKGRALARLGGRVTWTGFGLSRFATAFMKNPG
jgi:hypothetical protein